MKADVFNLKKMFVFMVCLTIVYTGLFIHSVNAAQNCKGTITQLVGTAFITGKQEGKVEAYNGIEVYAGSHINSLGTMMLEFNDGSKVFLSPNSIVAVNDNCVIILKKGNANFISSKGESIKLKPNDRIKIALESLKKKQDMAKVKKVFNKVLHKIIKVKQPTPPEVIEPASPAT